MTLLNPAYFDEIVGGLARRGLEVHHFCLTAPRDIVLERAAGRGDRGDWFPSKDDQYAGSLGDTRFGRHIDTAGRSADQVLDIILEHLPDPLPTGAHVDPPFRGNAASVSDRPPGC